jgi:uncharacterized protein (TIGR02145 family)
MNMKRSFAILLAALALAACNEKPEEPAVPQQVRITPVITRATDVNFEDGDAIGLTITRAAGAYATNEKLTYSGTSFSGSLNWYSEGNETSSLKAYYPYSATVPATFTVQTDQSQGITSSDFMSATKSDVYPTANDVAMVFTHKLTKILVKITNESGGTIEGVKMGGVIPTAVIDPDTYGATVSTSAEATTIKAYKVDQNTYALIVPAQTATMTVTVTASGKELSQKLTATEMGSGFQYTTEVRVLPQSLQVKISGDITNWNDGGSIGADGNVSFEEFENNFVYDGVSYNIKTMKDGRKWMTDPLRFVPAGKTPSTNPAEPVGIWYPYTTAGVAATDEASIAARGFLYDAATAFGVAEVNSDNYKTFEGTQGICPKGWYIPTREDFVALLGNSASTYGDVVESGAYWDSDYKGGRIKTMDADGWNWGFNGMINRTDPSKTGSYQKVATTTSNCSVEEYIGRLSMTFLTGSTANPNISATTGNIQFIGLMSSFTASYKEGRLSISFQNFLSGYPVRCIKAKQ